MSADLGTATLSIVLILEKQQMMPDEGGGTKSCGSCRNLVIGRVLASKKNNTQPFRYISLIFPNDYTYQMYLQTNHRPLPFPVLGQAPWLLKFRGKCKGTNS